MVAIDKWLSIVAEMPDNQILARGTAFGRCTNSKALEFDTPSDDPKWFNGSMV
jgi:hypothetical protein